MRGGPGLGIFLMFLASMWTAAPGAAQEGPQIAIAGDQLVVSGLPAGGKALVAGAMQVAYEHVGFVWSGSAELLDDDNDGSVSWTLPWEPSPLSTWVAVNSQTGKFSTQVGMADPDLRLRSFPANRLVEVATTGEASLLLRPALEEVVLVRPGVGAWKGRTAPDTVAATPEELAAQPLYVASLEALPETSALPPTPQAGDILVAIDPHEVVATVKKLVATDIVNQ